MPALWAMTTLPSEQQRALRALTGKASKRLEAVWRQSLATNALTTKSALLDLVPAVGDQFALASGSLAADWYDDLRDEKGVRGRFVAEPADLVGMKRYEALVGWAIGPLFGDSDPDAALSNLDGGMQRIVANAYRDTVTTSSVRDPRARGWARDGRGECSFCQMLIDRGAVYTEATADFESHDRCHCIAVPTFD